MCGRYFCLVVRTRTGLQASPSPQPLCSCLGCLAHFRRLVRLRGKVFLLSAGFGVSMMDLAVISSVLAHLYCPPTESNASGANLYMIHAHPTSYTQAYVLSCTFLLGSLGESGSGAAGLGSLAAYQRNVQSLSPALACLHPSSFANLACTLNRRFVTETFDIRVLILFLYFGCDKWPSFPKLRARAGKGRQGGPGGRIGFSSHHSAIRNGRLLLRSNRAFHIDCICPSSWFS